MEDSGAVAECHTNGLCHQCVDQQPAIACPLPLMQPAPACLRTRGGAGASASKDLRGKPAGVCSGNGALPACLLYHTRQVEIANLQQHSYGKTSVAAP